ncbi:growth inhibitor PemK [Candidatus Gracilibacteria bacterium]|nr:growth inhibitor PemK [Candidatus Gracilibacteria bacterium]
MKVFFTDLSEYKIRPVYIFKKYENEDYLFFPLSSNLSRNGIIIDNSHLESGILHKKSVIIIPKIGLIHQSLILENIGELKDLMIKNIHAEICKSLGCC